MKHFFSIIVPIYNVERYLPQCINSVLNQDFKDYELILVDDGSPDNCPHICDEFALKDKRIRVIHKKNGGLSDARNAGMEISTGIYIVFLDSDDYLTEDSLKKAYDIFTSNNKVDILMSTFNSLFSDEVKVINKFMLTKQYGKVDNHNKILSVLLTENNEIPWSAWRNIYKAELLKRNDIKFEKGLIGAEDCAFFMEYTKYVKSYAVMEYPLTNYRVSREGSITNTIKYNAVIGQLNVFSKYFYDFKLMKIDDNNKSIIYNHFAEKFANTVSTLHFLKNIDEINAAEKIVEENREILKYARGKKYAAAKILWKIFGYYKGSKLIRILRK